MVFQHDVFLAYSSIQRFLCPSFSISTYPLTKQATSQNNLLLWLDSRCFNFDTVTSCRVEGARHCPWWTGVVTALVTCRPRTQGTVVGVAQHPRTALQQPAALHVVSVAVVAAAAVGASVAVKHSSETYTFNSAYNDCPGTGVFWSLYPNIVIGKNRYILASWLGPWNSITTTGIS